MSCLWLSVLHPSRRDLGGLRGEVVSITLRETLLSPEELAQNLDLSPATLATWRCQRKGPSFLRIGRKIWYPKEHVKSWLDSALTMNQASSSIGLREVTSDGAASSEREMVL